MKVETPALRAARLLRPKHDQLASAVARQLKRSVPRYKDVERAALEKNIKTILGGMQRLLEKGDLETLKGIVEGVAQLRGALGFGVDELIMAGLCFMPVIRRYLIEADGDVLAGLEAFDALESLALPLFGHIASNYTSLSKLDDTQLHEVDWGSISFPLTIEGVGDDEEDTVRTTKPPVHR